MDTKTQDNADEAQDDASQSSQNMNDCWSLPRSTLHFPSIVTQLKQRSDSGHESPDCLTPNYLSKETFECNDQGVIGSYDSAVSGLSSPPLGPQQLTWGGQQLTYNQFQTSSSLPVLSALRNSAPQHPPVQPMSKYWDTKESALIELTNRTKYPILQKNGQRIYGGPPPDWIGPAPEKGTEIFVGKVPRDMYEDELVPIFERVGKIYELRLMLDFSGSNRGFLFVRYSDPEEARRAVRMLNNYQIRPNKFIGVVMSVDNRKLWISGVPPGYTSDDIKDEMSKITPGVTGVKVFPPRVNRLGSGYFYVEYENHRMAALARRRLVPGNIMIGSLEITKVDWAEPEQEVDDAIMSSVKILFVRNLPLTTSEADLYATFNRLSGGPNVERIKKFPDFAFIHFRSRESAETALRSATASGPLMIHGERVEVTWSKPVEKQGPKRALNEFISSQPKVHNYGPINHVFQNSMPNLPTFTPHMGFAPMHGQVQPSMPCMTQDEILERLAIAIHRQITISGNSNLFA